MADHDMHNVIEMEALEEDVVELTRDEWVAQLESLGDARGYFQPLGADHAAVFTDEGPTLLVTFETIDGIMEAGGDGLPAGFGMVDGKGWSQLCVLAFDQTFFRAPEVYGYIDRLVDDGFFEDFDRVVFYGAGPAAHAAAAFSVAAPGATVIAIQPQATLDRARVDWDSRFASARRGFVTNRYNFAPDMLDAADSAFILYDPRELLDAAHAALFARPHVARLPLPMLGGQIEAQLRQIGILDEIIHAAMAGQLDTSVFWKLWRDRRNHLPLMRAYLTELVARKKNRAVVHLARHVLRSHAAPRFRRAGEAASQNLLALGIDMPLGMGEPG